MMVVRGITDDLFLFAPVPKWKPAGSLLNFPLPPFIVLRFDSLIFSMFTELLYVYTQNLEETSLTYNHGPLTWGIDWLTLTSI